jgi:glycosyltransferase involved in cell wall biosynthesis
VTSWYHKQQLEQLHNVQKKNKIEVITNGYDEDDFREVKAYRLYPDKLTITFLGSFYEGCREQALKFLEIAGKVSEKIELVFIGRGAAELQGVSKDNLTCIYNLPQEKALSLAKGSDFLLLLLPPTCKWIPGKIYEYLRSGRPIIALCDEDSDAARIINESKTGVVLSYEDKKMKSQLETIVKRWNDGEFKLSPDREYITQFERRKLIEKLSRIFDDILNIVDSPSF